METIVALSLFSVKSLSALTFFLVISFFWTYSKEKHRIRARIKIRKFHRDREKLILLEDLLFLSRRYSDFRGWLNNRLDPEIISEEQARKRVNELYKKYVGANSGDKNSSQKIEEVLSKVKKELLQKGTRPDEIKVFQ